MNVGKPTKTLGKFGPLTFIATCTAGANPVASISVTASKTIDISPNLGSLTVLAPGDSPLVLATADGTDPRNAQPAYPAAATPGDKSFALSGSGGWVAENNATGADCAFWGDLQNDGS